ncbi:MAG: DsrE family protein [Pseudomonadota bacterium]
MKSVWVILLASLGWVAALPVAAAGDPRAEVERVLARQPLPPGIVFDIMTGEADALDSMLPQVEALVARVREKAPALDLAVVTHGNEMFALKRSEAFVHEKAHASARRLVEAKVEVYVCGAYAEMRKVAWEEFVPFVLVAASGPATVNDYRALGYAVVFIGDPNFTPRQL